MSLTGTLQELGLPDVLHLIARSGRTGSLRVSGDGLSGHVFFRQGALAYATTRSEDSFVGDLVRMGLVGEDQRADLERRRVNVADVIGTGPDREKLAEFLQEQIKEVTARLLRLERGRFEFQDGVEPRYETGRTFDVEALLEGAVRRLARWREIEEVIPSPATTLHMARSLPNGREEVTLDPLSWSLLACLDGTAGVQTVARRLGMWEFPAAQAAARMVREGLLELGDEAPAVVHERPPTAAETLEERAEPEPEEQADQPPVEEAAEAPTEPPEEAVEEEPPDQPDEEPEDESPSELMRRWKELRSQR